MKNLSRMAGLTSASNPSVQGATTPSNRSTPFVDQPAGTKFAAYGEPATSDSFNRAFAALAENTDFLASVLDSATARSEVFDKDSAFSLESKYGSSVQLAGGVWLYTGLTPRSSYVCTKFYPVKSSLDVVTDMSTPAPRLAGVEVSATSIFTGQTSRDSADINSDVSNIPPIAAVSATSPNIVSWLPDGLVMNGDAYDSTTSWYVRPGVMIKVSGSGTNNGIYTLSTYSGPNLLLTSANLHKITLTGVGTAVVAGQLLEWTQPGGVANKTKAYAAHVGILDSGVQEVWFPTFNGAASLISTEGFNDIGRAWAEDSDDTFAKLPAGTTIRYASGIDFTFDLSASVSSVEPAGTSATFDPTQQTGTVSICNPIGFTLDPDLQVSPSFHGADYIMSCMVMTTVKDKLLGINGVGSAASISNTDLLDFTPLDALRTERSILTSKYGSGVGSINDTTHWFGASRNVLGADGWIIHSDNSPASAAVAIGETITISNSAVAASDITATGVVTGYHGTTHIVVSDFRITAGDIGQTIITAGDTTFTASGGYGPTVISDYTPPEYRDGSGIIETSVFGPGLDAAYNLTFSSFEDERESGMGNQVRMTTGRPVNLLMDADEDRGVVLTGDDDYTLVKHEDTSGDIQAEIKSVAGALVFADANTEASSTSEVPFTSAANDTSPAAFQDESVMGMLAGTVSQEQFSPARLSGFLNGSWVFSSPNIVFTLPAGSFIAAGCVYVTVETEITLPASVTRYLYWDTPTDTLTLGAALEPDNSRFYIAKAVTDANSVTSLTYIMFTGTHMNERVGIKVGLLGADGYLNGLTDFPTLGKAFECIDIWATAPTAPYKVASQWDVEVITSTTETATLDIPSGNIRIHSSPSATSNAATVSWAGSWELFNLNNADNVVIEGISANFTGTLATGADPVEMFIQSTTDTSGLIVRDCTVTNAASFIDVSGGGGLGATLNNGVLSGNRATGLLSNAIYIADSSHIRVADNYFSQTGGTVTTNRTNAVYISSDTNAYISGNTITTSASDGFVGGIWVYGTCAAHISDNNVTTQTEVSIYTHNTLVEAVLANNVTAPSNGTCRALETGTPGTLVSNCSLGGDVHIGTHPSFPTTASVLSGCKISGDLEVYNSDKTSVSDVTVSGDVLVYGSDYVSLRGVTIAGALGVGAFTVDAVNTAPNCRINSCYVLGATTLDGAQGAIFSGSTLGDVLFDGSDEVVINGCVTQDITEGAAVASNCAIVGNTVLGGIDFTNAVASNTTVSCNSVASTATLHVDVTAVGNTK